MEKDIDKSKASNKNKHVKATSSIDEIGPTNKGFRPTSTDSTYSEYITKQNKLPEEKKDGFIERQWNKKIYSYREKYGPGARDAFLDDLKHNTPKMMFLLLPLFALILRVAFWKNKKFYVEHMIYSFHFHCFLFLFLGIIILLQMIIPASWSAVSGWLTFLEVIYIAWYIYRSLKEVYHRSRFRTISKMIGMSFMYFFAFTFCLCLLFFVTAIL